MNIECNRPLTVFKHEFEDGNIGYSIGLSKTNQAGEYINGYIPVKFQKDVSLENKTRIYIKSAWLSFNLFNKQTKIYIFINEFEYVEDLIKKAKEEIEQLHNEEQITIDDNFLD